MAAPMVKTRTPGVYKRGGRYVATWWVKGKMRKKSARTLEEARRIKAGREAEIHSGEYQEQSRVRFGEFAEDWIERYGGTGRSGFRESTRDDYRRDLRWYAYPYFDERLSRRLTEITPRDVARWIAWLCDAEEQGRRRHEEKRRQAKASGKPMPAGPAKAAPLADATVRRIVSPMRACLATARREGLIRHNPVDGATLPHRPRAEADEPERARALTREQLAMLLRVAPGRHRLFLRLLAETGLRWSEAIELRRKDLQLDGSSPHVKVRRARVRDTIGPPKSRHSRRNVPISPVLVDQLRALLKSADPGGEVLVFPNDIGGHLDHSNMLRRVLRPAAEEAAAPWATFHTLRHTCASLLFDRGANAVKVQHWLGHHSPAFTLETYVHLLDDQLDEPLDLEAELNGKVASGVGRRPVSTEAGGRSAIQAAIPDAIPEPV
jgi:integrase